MSKENEKKKEDIKWKKIQVSAPNLQEPSIATVYLDPKNPKEWFIRSKKKGGKYYMVPFDPDFHIQHPSNAGGYEIIAYRKIEVLNAIRDSISKLK